MFLFMFYVYRVEFLLILVIGWSCWLTSRRALPKVFGRSGYAYIIVQFIRFPLHHSACTGIAMLFLVTLSAYFYYITVLKVSIYGVVSGPNFGHIWRSVWAGLSFVMFWVAVSGSYWFTTTLVALPIFFVTT